MFLPLKLPGTGAIEFCLKAIYRDPSWHKPNLTAAGVTWWERGCSVFAAQHYQFHAEHAEPSSLHHSWRE